MYNQNKKRTTTIALLPEEKTASKILLSSIETFDWRSKFMFCGGPCQKNIRNPNRNNCHKVTTLHFKEKVLLLCQKRDDQISKEVALRVRSCNDLVAVEARYHTSCRITFMNPEKKHTFLEKKMRKSLLGGQLRTKSCSILISYVSRLNRKWSVNTVKELHQKMIEIADSPLFTQQNG